MEVVQLKEGCTDKPISQATLIPFTSNFLHYQGMVLAFPNAVQSSGSVPISPPYGDNRVFQYPNVSPPISRQPLHLQPRMQCLSMQITSVILTTPQASLLDQYCRRYRTFKLFMLFCSISTISRRPRGQSSRFFFPLAALDNTFPTSPHSSWHDSLLRSYVLFPLPLLLIPLFVHPTCRFWTCLPLTLLHHLFTISYRHCSLILLCDSLII